MKKNPEQAADIAAEIINAEIRSGVLSAPRNKSGSGKSIDRVRIRAIELKTGKAFQIEETQGPQVFHRNVTAQELVTLLAGWLTDQFAHAEFSTANGIVSVLANRRGELSAIRKPAKLASDAGKGESAGPDSGGAHNRVKNYILKEGVPVPFLVDLGVMSDDGSIIKSKYDKFRQINRFLEFIEDVLPELKTIAETREITVIDFGCGKSYLTFAVYYYLAILERLPVRIVGLDLKRDVIENCAELARRYGYDQLKFQVGDIAGYRDTESADMVITLHACDTATDFALAQAVRWKTKIILSVPCCQHELNKQLAEREPAVAGQNAGGRTMLEPAFKYGIIRERMAALFTDAMRAELLESQGYRVQILEFIDMSHTPKNLLIRAVRIDRSILTERAKTANEKTEPAQSGSYAALREYLGVDPTLERELKKKQ